MKPRVLVVDYGVGNLLSVCRAFEACGAAVELTGEPSREDRYFILFWNDQKASSADAPVLLAQQVEGGRRAKEWIDREVLPNDWVAVVSYDVKLKVHQDFTHDHQLLTAAVNDAVKGKEAEILSKRALVQAIISTELEQDELGEIMEQTVWIEQVEVRCEPYTVLTGSVLLNLPPGRSRLKSCGISFTP